MKVGDLVKFKKAMKKGSEKVFLIMRTQDFYFSGLSQKVWIFPDPRAGAWGPTDDDNYYFGHYFEVVSESR